MSRIPVTESDENSKAVPTVLIYVQRYPCETHRAACLALPLTVVTQMKGLLHVAHVLINSCLSLYCLHDFLISKENFTETYTVHHYQKTLPFFPHCSTHRTFKSSHLLSPIFVQLPTSIRIITISTSMSCDFSRLS